MRWPIFIVKRVGTKFWRSKGGGGEKKLRQLFCIGPLILFVNGTLQLFKDPLDNTKCDTGLPSGYGKHGTVKTIFTLINVEICKDGFLGRWCSYRKKNVAHISNLLLFYFYSYFLFFIYLIFLSLKMKWVTLNLAGIQSYFAPYI